MYKATVTSSDNEVKTYTGCTDRTFKKRHYGHISDMKHKENRKNTSLAGYIWEKKDAGKQIVDIKWEILKECTKYQPGNNSCDVCLSEKLCIMKENNSNTLNRRSELMNKCRHKWKWRLKSTENERTRKM